METIRCSPILVCRTKYIDYPTGKPFCCPNDLSLKNFELLIAMMSNGDNLSPTIRSCRIFINDGTHCIIGKYGKLSVFLNNTNMEIDLSLDKATGGREPWGFIGAVIRTSDFIAFGNGFDLSDNYYTNVYVEYLYKEHWLEQQFTGTYHYPYVDETVQLIYAENSEIIKLENGYIIETDDKNLLLFAFALECALKGEKISFCTNAEYNASRLISENKVSAVTVSTKNLGMHKVELQKPKKEMQKIEESKQKDVYYTHEQEGKHIYEETQEQPSNIGYYKIPLFNLYLGCEKIENCESIVECIFGNRRLFLTKQVNIESQTPKKAECRSDKSVSTEKQKFNSEKRQDNSTKNNYKF